MNGTTSHRKPFLTLDQWLKVFMSVLKNPKFRSEALNPKRLPSRSRTKISRREKAKQFNELHDKLLASMDTHCVQAYVDLAEREYVRSWKFESTQNNPDLRAYADIPFALRDFNTFCSSLVAGSIKYAYVTSESTYDTWPTLAWNFPYDFAQFVTDEVKLAELE